MNKQLYYALIMCTQFWIPHHINSMDKKRARDFSPEMPRAKRVKKSLPSPTLSPRKIYQTREFELDWHIVQSIAKKETHKLILYSNWLIKNMLDYTIIDLDTLARRMHNHHKLYRYFITHQYTTYAQENLNATRKTYSIWLKRSELF